MACVSKIQSVLCVQCQLSRADMKSCTRELYSIARNGEREEAGERARDREGTSAGEGKGENEKQMQYESGLRM